MIKLAIIILSFGSVGLLSAQFLPSIAGKFKKLQARRTTKAIKAVEESHLNVRPAQVALMYAFAPILLGIIGFYITKALLGVIIGVGLGFAFPGIWVKIMKDNRCRKFHTQLVDALMLLSSSLKAGLSLIQAFDNLVKEMPAPISEEFGKILAENRMGVNLEESFKHLNQRIPSPELNMLTTSILLARETGGNLPEIFSRLIKTIREKTKIAENVKTLTLQGRIQGAVMSILPVAFCFVVLRFQPEFFDIMKSSEVGRVLLFYALFSWVMGVLLIYRISKLNF